MKILITGGTGLVGNGIKYAMQKTEHICIYLGSSDCIMFINMYFSR